MELPIDFKVCPLCGSTETVAQIAVEPFKVLGRIDKNAPVHTRVNAVPLIQPSLAVAFVPTLILHYDSCAGCGIEYCTRAEVINAPIKFQQQSPDGQLPFGGFGRG